LQLPGGADIVSFGGRAKYECRIVFCHEAGIFETISWEWIPIEATLHRNDRSWCRNPIQIPESDR
jgi:hypothetical protein